MFFRECLDIVLNLSDFGLESAYLDLGIVFAEQRVLLFAVRIRFQVLN